MTREVAYETLTFATRTTLHEQIGLYIEQNYGDSLEQYISLLAYHFDHSSNLPKKREYLRRAGEAAQAAYSNEVALDYYSRVLELLSEAEQVEVLLKIGQVLELVGRWDEAAHRFQGSLELAEQLDNRVGIARAEMAEGSLLLKQKRFAEAEPALRLARAVFQELGDLAGASLALTEIGEVYRLQGNYPAATNHYQESLALAERVENSNPRLSVRARTFKALGTLATRQGAYAEARLHFETGLNLNRELSDKLGSANLLNNLSILSAIQDDFATARSFSSQSLVILREVGDRFGMAVALNNMGMMGHDQGDQTAARNYLEQSLRNRRSLGDRWGVANVLSSLADVALAQSDYNFARSCLSESLNLNRQLNDRLALAYGLEYSAGLAAAENQVERALQLAGAAAAIRQLVGAPLSAKEQALLDSRLELARTTLGETASATAWQAGMALSLEQAVDFALTF